LKKYLESLGKTVRHQFPVKFKVEDVKRNADLPYFNEVESGDTRELLKSNEFDAVILVDGSNVFQFYDTTVSEDDPPKFLELKKVLLVDHHPEQHEKIATKVVRETKASSTAEVIFRELLPAHFIDKDIATLGYKAIMSDTGNFQWNFFSSTLEVCAKLLDRGINIDLIIDQFSFNKTKESFELLSLVIENLTFDEKLGSCFLLLSNSARKKLNIDPRKLKIIRDIFLFDVARRIPEYPRGFFIYEGDNDTVHIHGRGSSLRNKISLPKLFGSLGSNSGGHFNASGMVYEGGFEEYKEKFLVALAKAVKESTEAEK